MGISYRPDNPFAPKTKQYRPDNPFAKQQADTGDINLGTDIDSLKAQVKRNATRGSQRVGQEQKTEPGTLGSALSGAAQGSTFGFADEILGGIDAANSLLPTALGGQGAHLSGLPEKYREGREKVRAYDKNAARTHGTAHTIASIAGSLAPIALSGGAGLAGEASTGAKLLSASKAGAGYGALQGVGDAKELSDVPSQALRGGTIGAVTAPALYGLGKAGAGLVRATGFNKLAARGATALSDQLPRGAFADALSNIGSAIGKNGRVNRQIAQGLKTEGNTPSGILGRVEQNIAASGEKPELLADYSPELQKVTKALTKIPGEARAKIVAAIQARNAGTRGRVLQDFTQGGRSVAFDPEAAMSPDLPTTLPPAPNAPVRPTDPSPGIRDRLAQRFQQVTGAGQNDVRQAAEQEVRDRAASGAQMFDAAHSSDATLDTPEAHELFKRPVMRTFWERAQRMAANRGETLPTRPSGALSDEMERYINTGIPAAEREQVRQTFLKDPRHQAEVPIPNVRALHYMDIALRDSQKGFEGASGVSRSDANDARAIMDQFRPMIAEVEPALPAAQADYAGRSRSIEAYDTGLKFFKNLTSAKPPKGALGAGDPVALKSFRTGIDGLEQAVQHMAPEDVPRFRQAAQQMMLERLQGVAPTESGSTAKVIRSILTDDPQSQRWQRLLFNSPDEFAQFQNAVQGERAGVANYRGAVDQYRTDLQGHRAALSARRGEEKLIGRAQNGNAEAQQALAARLPNGGQSTLRRLGQSSKVSEVNSVPATVTGSTNPVLRRAFPDSPADRSILQGLFPDQPSFDRFSSSLGRERQMAATASSLNGSDTAENLAENEARQFTSLLSHLVHPVRATRQAASAFDRLITKRNNAALGKQLGTMGSGSLRELLAEVARGERGHGLLTQGSDALRNALVRQAGAQ